MFKDSRNLPPQRSKPTSDGASAEQPVALKPWEDRARTAEERMESYRGLVGAKLEEIRVAFDRARDANDIATQIEIMNSPETKEWMDEGLWLERTSPKAFCERIEYRAVRELLGKNFLGAEAWRAQGIEVGEEPNLPTSITRALLDSDCPLHPGEKIKDTHLLVLVPQTVNGAPYSALRLAEMCETTTRAGKKVMYGEWTSWKGQPWASASRARSEWVLISKGDPDPKKVSEDRHFRDKNVAEQQKTHDAHYQEYREVKTVELMTALLLQELVNHEPRTRDWLDYFRCQEPTDSGGRVCVGYFRDRGVAVTVDYDGHPNDCIGRALARK